MPTAGTKGLAWDRKVGRVDTCLLNDQFRGDWLYVATKQFGM
ncbi:hypothetical protein ALQ93_102355 [Pseudomonas syringae pv. pisi]|nr:hypothetical protein ALQ93_102355 [Pseudomonas syringae pv. pisi]RML63385.1 hypothetical protein ALQ92_101992 [Pseudomonas syringae pv. pisi]